MACDGTTFSPRITAKGIWTFVQENSADKILSGTNSTAELAEEGLRGSIEGGFDFANDNGFNFSLQGSYDGIGDDDFEAWGVRARIGHRW